MSDNAPNTGYQAALAEPKWYAAWEQAGLFQPDADTSKPLYTITIPPPNITGSLHMGHALCYGVQDLLGRYKRLRGFRVLVLPGQDHAGIATQAVVRKSLQKQGVNPGSLSRDEFVAKAWEWRRESGDTILRQFRMLGCAFDWTRQRFTLDEDYSRAVLTTFVDWFERGLIKRGLRVVNWDPVLKTSVSDIETERQTIQGKLYHVRYPFTDGSGHITIATTRPETILADVAVAVHPKDERYTNLVGKTLIVPVIGREVPLIADEYPDPEFGTGAVKITPGHDPFDFEVGQRHNLPILVMLDPDCKVTELGGPEFQGLDRKEARTKMVEALEAAGALEKIDDHEIAILISDRSKDIIEPLVSEQWFASQTTLAQGAIAAAESDAIQFFPPRYKDVYLEWMRNIRDWNVSRQLMWGHRIPVYYTEDGSAFAALTWEEAQAKAGDAKIVRQDDDVLDTWFSSGLWPFATMGWPKQTEDLATFYPTDVLVTSREILYLWVARMIMMGLDLTKQLPFKHVYIYATVLTEQGKRMSKSLGTGVDPVEVIETKGADALRFALFSQTGFNQDLRYGPRKIDDARNFATKVWNASRFVFMNLEGFVDEKPDGLQTVDRWILSRLAACQEAVTAGFEGYEVQSAVQALYSFFWSELCDWYIEISKSRLQDPAQRAVPQWVLVQCLRAFLVMLHPVMPHLTEEVYAQLPAANKKAFVMAEDWPEIPAEWVDADAEAKVDGWIETTRALRALRAECGASPIKQLPVAYFSGDLGEGEEVVRTQAWFAELKPGKPDEEHVAASAAGVDVYLPTQGLVDKEKEIQRLRKDLEKLLAEVSKMEGQLGNPQFVERAKPEVVDKLRANLSEAQDKAAKTEAQIKAFGG